MRKFKIGDQVRVVRKPTNFELKNWFGYNWLDRMDDVVGKIGVIKEIGTHEDDYNVVFEESEKLNIINCCFPEYILEYSRERKFERILK